jgi:toxin-antitoxin system PIN domain toxin
MLMLDVNVCVYAFRRESGGHEEYKAWLEQALSGPEPVGLPEQVLASMVRLVTNHRIYQEPSTPTAALSFCDALLSAPAAMRVRPGERHWGIFRGLVSRHGLRGNDIPDAYLAALALEQGATWVTNDRGFARYEGLGLLDPLAD